MGCCCPYSWLPCGCILAWVWGLYRYGSIGCTDKVEKVLATRGGSSHASNGNAWSFSPYLLNYFDRSTGGLDQKMNIGFGGPGALQQLPLSSNWSFGWAEKYGLHFASFWPLYGNHSSGLPYENATSRPSSIMKGWRNGDWICNCSFHNYSSCELCKECNASRPPGCIALGTKRLVS